MEAMLHTVPNLLVGVELEREIARIENQVQDEAIAKVISQRLNMAQGASAVTVSHDEVFSKSRARLLAKLSNNEG